MVIPLFAVPEKVYESFSPAALIEANNVRPQLMGVAARTIGGNIRTATKIRIRIANRNLNFFITIFRPSILMPTCL
jgi:hypothetical protein